MINNKNKLGHNLLDDLNEFYTAQSHDEAEPGSIIPIYTVRGNGEKRVIITHDWMGDTEGNWKHAVDYFDYLRFTYVFMDVRGYGKSLEIGGQFTIDEIAADIFKIADKLGWDKFYLIGHSMSGMAAQKAVLNDKDNRIKAVAALNPVSAKGFPVDRDTKNFFEKIITDIESAAAGFSMLVGDKLSKNWSNRRAERFFALTNKNAVLSYMNEWSTQNFFERTKEISTPFLVIYGEDDLEVWREKEQRQAFQYFKNVSFKAVANAGHYPMQQVPAYTVNLIESFILKN